MHSLLRYPSLSANSEQCCRVSRMNDSSLFISEGHSAYDSMRKPTWCSRGLYKTIDWSLWLPVLSFINTQYAELSRKSTDFCLLTTTFTITHENPIPFRYHGSHMLFLILLKRVVVVDLSTDVSARWTLKRGSKELKRDASDNFAQQHDVAGNSRSWNLNRNNKPQGM